MNDQKVHKKLSRIYVDAPLKNDAHAELSADQAHYFKNVMRRKEGEAIRVFNGVDGEWVAKIQSLSKKNGTLLIQEQLKEQPKPHKEITLMFCPIKKQRMDFLIEKAVELGASALQPILSQNTEVRKINEERINAQIIEAAEQCERLTIPKLLPLTKLENIITSQTSIYAALERAEGVPHINDIQVKEDCAFLIGPEGGFTEEESMKLQNAPSIQGVSLGEQILRAETAALYGLAYLNR